MQIPGYQILRKINQGGMSTVYLAIQLSVGREVALKVMSPALNADPIFSERFQREANIVGQLSHPNIISIYDIGCYKNLNYIAMDYLPGGSLHERMRQGISAREAMRICREMALALDHAHEKGYMHRDVKPENILFREDNSVVLSDFGVAKTVSSASRMTHTGTVVGTPHYMSPEQARGKTSDGRADIYGLGIVLYEMLTGTVPYKAEEAVAIAIKHLTAPVPVLPAQYSLYQALLNSLLAKETDDRLQRGRDIVEAIDRLESRSGRNSGVFIANTDPTAVQILSLVRALFITSSTALVSSVRDASIWRLRWQNDIGLHYRESKSPHIIRTYASTDESNYPTMVSSAVYIDPTSPLVTKKTHWRRLCLLSIALGLVWTLTAIAITRFEMAVENYLPPAASKLASMTHNAVMPDQFDLNYPSLTSHELSPRPQKQTASLDKHKEPLAPTSPLGKSSPSNTDKPQGEPNNKEINAGEEAAETTEKKLEKSPKISDTYTLTLRTKPANTKIRILNIKEKYHKGIKLPAGSYHLELSAKGYSSKVQWIRLRNKDRDITIHLAKIPEAGESFTDRLSAKTLGPEMIVVPEGKFIMGSKLLENTLPLREVKIRKAFGVSKYEITFADYDLYAQEKGLGRPNDKRWGFGARPVIHVSWHNAQQYISWLAQKTGKPYRLLNEAEWEYIARASSSDDFWWGSQKKGVSANCKRGCNSEFTNLFRSKTAPVGSFRANPFGLFDTAGNVAEWVNDCFQDHFLGAPRDGSAINRDQCDKRVVRGGSMKDNVELISAPYRRALSPESKKEYIGFRVALDIY